MTPLHTDAEVSLTLFWGAPAPGNVIAHTSVCARRPVRVGETTECDVFLPCLPRDLVTFRGGEHVIAPPPGSRVRIGGRELSCAPFVAAHERAIDVALETLCVRVVIQPRAALPPLSLPQDREPLFAMALSALLHLSLIVVHMVFLPHPAKAEELDLKTMLALIEASDARGASNALEADRASDVATSLAPSATSVVPAPPRAAFVSRQERALEQAPLVPASREEALAEAASFGMVGLLRNTATQDAPSVAWGAPGGGDASRGMWATDLSDALGAGSLGLSGVGEGCGGCAGEQIALGSIGTVGRGVADVHPRLIAECEPGLTCTRARPRAHVALAPTLRCPPEDDSCASIVDGRLPPEAVQRVVRANMGRMRLCYEDGLRNNPSLAGRITVRFVIDRDGTVAFAKESDGSFPDGRVGACVVQGFRSLSFPDSEGGVIDVSYSLSLSPISS